MKWRLLCTGQRSGAENIAADEAILLVHSRGGNQPTLRFYGWSPPALTLGYFQDLRETVDLDACARHGIDVVRRPTGGRAVLHHQEVTYSIVAGDDHPAVRGTITESYLRLSRGLLLGLRLLGAEVELSGGGQANGKGQACFDSPSQHELVAGGRKLVGSAQCRRGGCVLQHGALPLSSSADTLYAVLRFPSEETRESELLRFRQSATSLEEALGRRAGPEEVIKALAEGFAGALGLDLEPGEMTEEELALTKRLAREKYGNLLLEKY